MAVDEPAFATEDFRDVRFDAPVPSSYRARQSAGLSGRISTADERSDSSQVLVRFWRYGGSSEDSIRVWGTINSNGTFSIQHEWTEAQRGRYLMEVFRFWPGAPAQYPRAIAGPVIVR